MIDFDDTLKAIGQGLLSIFTIIVIFAILSSINLRVDFNPLDSLLSIAISYIVLFLIVIFVIFVLKTLREFIEF